MKLSLATKLAAGLLALSHYYGGVWAVCTAPAITGDVAGNCVCPSGQTYASGSCAAATTPSSPCSSAISSTYAAQAGLSLGLNSTSFGTADQLSGNDVAVALTFRLPWVYLRSYTGLWLVDTNGQALANCDAANVFSLFSYAQVSGRGEAGPYFAGDATNNMAPGCYDVWNVQANFSRLTGCGLVRSTTPTVNVPGSGFETYDGVLRVVCCYWFMMYMLCCRASTDPCTCHRRLRSLAHTTPSCTHELSKQ